MNSSYFPPSLQACLPTRAYEPDIRFFFDTEARIPPLASSRRIEFFIACPGLPLSFMGAFGVVWTRKTIPPLLQKGSNFSKNSPFFEKNRPAPSRNGCFFSKTANSLFPACPAACPMFIMGCSPAGLTSSPSPSSGWPSPAASSPPRSLPPAGRRSSAASTPGPRCRR
jgi:hypothetical protein